MPMTKRLSQSYDDANNQREVLSGVQAVVLLIPFETPMLTLVED